MALTNMNNNDNFNNFVNSKSSPGYSHVLHNKLIEMVSQIENNLNEKIRNNVHEYSSLSSKPLRYHNQIHKSLHSRDFLTRSLTNNHNSFITSPIDVTNVAAAAATISTTTTTTPSTLINATAHHLHQIITSATTTTGAADANQLISQENNDNNSANAAGPSASDNNYLLDEVANILKLTDYCYVLSLVTLILALIILTSVKRLRCPKNNIHLQLFISFIIRAGSHLIRRTTDVETIDSNLWSCKLITSIWQYSLLANYSWILMEGLYLNSLIFSKTINPHGPSILIYTIFGWFAPLLCITPWIIVKSSYEDRSCWRDSTDGPYFWILRLPITISILINFSIYIKIILVLYSKIFTGSLQISTTSAKNNYKRLLRSTLVLIPLFGIHYTGLLLVQQWVSIATQGKSHDRAEIVQLYIETFISSLQGFIVALLYCFLNGEVHQEIKRLWWNSITNSN